MYNNGQGITKRNLGALRWYCKAADQGNVMAQCALSLMCAKGQGVPHSYKWALAWFRKAADQENAGE